MKIRAKKEQIKRFLNKHSELVCLSVKSGWSTIRFDFRHTGGTGTLKLDDSKIKKMWIRFTNEEEQAFEDSMMKALLETREEKELTTSDTSFHTQFDYKGNKESVPANEYKIKIECKCGELRWVKASDEFQVHMCKPCTIKERRKRQYQNRKARKQLENNTDSISGIIDHGKNHLELQGLTIH